MVLLRVARVACAVVLGASPALAQTKESPPAEPPPIANLTPNLYRFQVGAQVGVFLVTADGIVLADPLGGAAAEGLERAFAQRFPDRPVRYVLHTSPRFNRAEGAYRFTKTAEIVGHASFNAELSRARRETPSYLRDLDRDRNGRFDPTELGNDARAASIIERDRDNDGRVTLAELYQSVSGVESEYARRRKISSGGNSVELVHIRQASGTDTTALHFPQERYLFIDRFPDLSRPFAAVGSTPRDVIAMVHTLAALDIDTVLTSDGITIAGADVRALSAYLRDLQTGVMAAYEAGETVAQLQTSAFLDAHRETPYYAQRQTHIAEVFTTLRDVRVAADVTSIVHGFPSDGVYCESYTACGHERFVPGAKAGLRISFRRFVTAVELSLEQQSLSSRTGPLYEDAWQRREAIGSFLVGRTGAPARTRTYSLLGGLSVIRADAAGISHLKQTFVSLGGRRPHHDRWTHLGLTGGIDVALGLGERMALVVPVRTTYLLRDGGELRPSRLTFVVGAGLRVRAYRSH